jgi:flagellar assembly protein FliH
MLSNRLVARQKARDIHFQDLSNSVGSTVETVVKPGNDEAKEIDSDEIEREAFQKGFEAGRDSGMELGAKKVEAMLNRFTRSLEELAKLRTVIVSECEKDLARLAIEIARKLVHREVQIDEEIIVTLARVALSKLIQKAPVVLYLNREDHQILTEHFEQNPNLFEGREIELKVKSDLSRGDCLLESPYGDLDARLSEQFKQIEHNLISEF